METLPFGSGGPLVPVIGIGTWKMELDDRAAAVAAIRRAVDLGLTHVDTAEMYGAGRVEAVLGEALQGIRDRVYLVSKVLPENASWRGTVAACERSLRALRTDRLDAYLLHWPGDQPLEETIAAFEELKAAGKIRTYGVSNFDVDRLEEAVRIAGEGKIACNQVLYNLEERTVEHVVKPWCERNGVAVVAYSPMGAEKFRSSPAVENVAKTRGVAPRAVALAWLAGRARAFAIPKTANLAHLEELAKAASIWLSDDEARRIEADFPVGPLRGLATA